LLFCILCSIIWKAMRSTIWWLIGINAVFLFLILYSSFCCHFACCLRLDYFTLEYSFSCCWHQPLYAYSFFHFIFRKFGSPCRSLNFIILVKSGCLVATDSSISFVYKYWIICSAKKRIICYFPIYSLCTWVVHFTFSDISIIYQKKNYTLLPKIW
jgi:hypothetical protein